MGKFIFLGFFVIFLVFHIAKSQDQPLKNVNLSPLWQWKSAYECLQNETLSGVCLGNNILKLDGLLSVNQSEVEDYCKPGGCAEQTQHVLKCIHWVKRDFWFANKATIFDLNNTIANGCATQNQGISTANFKSNAKKLYQSLIVSFVASMSTLVFITIFSRM